MLTIHYYRNLWLIGLSLLVEWPAIKIVTNLSWSKSIIPLIVCNTFSALIGTILIPLGGYINVLIWAIPVEVFDLNVGNDRLILPTGFLLLITITVYLEILALKLFFNHGFLKFLKLKSFDKITFTPSKRDIILITVSNLISVGFAIYHLEQKGFSFNS